MSSEFETRPFTEDEIRTSQRDAKIGLIATVDRAGLPHVTLITSLQARDPLHLTYGQFCGGLSKTHVKENAHTGFLIMSPEREIWRGKALWTHEAKSGPEYELYNQKPMFRYNSYFGIHTVHYLDVVARGSKERLDVPRIAMGSVIASLCRRRARAGGNAERVLNPWTEAHIGKTATLKFLSYVDGDGYPTIIPVVPCRPADDRRLLFAPSVYRRELTAIRPGTSIAVFALNLQMESVLVRGVFAGCRRCLGFPIGTIDVDWVYNSMPPKHGTVYPTVALRAITQF